MSALALQRAICALIFIGSMVVSVARNDRDSGLVCLLAAFLFAYLAANAQRDFNRANGRKEA